MALVIVLMVFLIPVLFVGAVAVAAAIELLCATGAQTSLDCCPETAAGGVQGGPGERRPRLESRV